MRQDRVEAPSYVIKAHELPALKHLPPDHPRPQGLLWIDRGRNSKLQRTTIEMLMRTLFRETSSQHVERLHQRAGLRVMFRSHDDRRIFAKLFQDALRSWGEGNEA